MPEVPLDAGQKYLDTDNVRPILPLLREMHKEGKLTPEQAYFFRPQKEIEQLYDLDVDPWELNNLATSSEHQNTKEELQGKLFQWIGSANDHGLEKTPGGTWKPKREENPTRSR